MVNEKMEYIGKCPDCGKHNIIDAKRRIKPKAVPVQRYGPCQKCRKVKRQRIIGEIVYLARLARRNTKALRFWQ